MSHELERDPITGEYAFVSAADGERIDPWHRLGTVIDRTLTIDEMLKMAHLDWEVRATPLSAENFYGTSLEEVPNQQAVHRVWPDLQRSEILAVVGGRYDTIQNRELFEQLVDTIEDETGGKFTTAGSLKGGRRVFGTVEIPGDLRIGDDSYKQYLAGVTSHDGTLSAQIWPTNVRIVCQNTLSMSLTGATTVFSVRHTGSAGLKLESVGKAVETYFTEVADWQNEAERLLDTVFEDANFIQLMDTTYPLIDEEDVAYANEAAQQRAATRRKTIRKQLWNLWNGPTQGTVKDTAWGAYQTYVEWADWMRPVKASGDESRLLTRAEAAITPASGSEAIKAEALAKIHELVA